MTGLELGYKYADVAECVAAVYDEIRKLRDFEEMCYRSSKSGEIFLTDNIDEPSSRYGVPYKVVAKALADFMTDESDKLQKHLEALSEKCAAVPGRHGGGKYAFED